MPKASELQGLKEGTLVTAGWIGSSPVLSQPPSATIASYVKGVCSDGGADVIVCVYVCVCMCVCVCVCMCVCVCVCAHCSQQSMLRA